MVLQASESDSYSINEIVSKYGINRTTLKDWRYKYQTYGVMGLQNSTQWTRYSKELKLAAVEECLSGKLSIKATVKKYGISSTSVLRKWIKLYNRHRDIKEYVKGMTFSMTKASDILSNERIEIAIHCLSNKRNYQKTAEQYDVTYQQVYTWVRKYERDGEESLRVRQRRKSIEKELSVEEQHAKEFRKLQKENERLRAENEFLKKLDRLERRY